MNTKTKILAVVGALVVAAGGVVWATTSSGDDPDQEATGPQYPDLSAIRIVESTESTKVLHEPGEDGEGTAMGLINMVIENTSDWIATDVDIHIKAIAPDGTTAGKRLLVERGYPMEFLTPGSRIGFGHSMTWRFDEGSMLDPSINEFSYTYEVTEQTVEWLPATPELIDMRVEFSDLTLSGGETILDPVVIDATVTTNSDTPVIVDTVSAIFRHNGEIIGGALNGFVRLESLGRATLHVKKGEEYHIKVVVDTGGWLLLTDIDFDDMDIEIFLGNDPREELGR